LKYYSEESIKSIVNNFNNDNNNEYTEDRFIYDIYTNFKEDENKYNENRDDNIKKYEIVKSIYESFIKKMVLTITKVLKRIMII